MTRDYRVTAKANDPRPRIPTRCRVPGARRLSGRKPGEEFKGLVDDLARQYKPEGPDESDAFWTMAAAMWRKQHLEIFQRAAQARLWFGQCSCLFREGGGAEDG